MTGLSPDGVIITTNTNYEQGNSGGPVFYKNNDGELIVIGVVSAGAGRTMGFIVPIAAVR
jgi:S1-C subfamily serine protease